MCWCFFRKKKRPSIEIVVTNDILEKANEECPICLEPLRSDLCMITKQCSHFFHYDCYIQYVDTCAKQENTEVYCPLCRTVQSTK
jgi:hypothetical protein